MPSDADRPRAPLDLDRVLEPIVRELVAEGAAAVVLAGSHARGEAGELSDVDLYAIGNGPHYTLRAANGLLLSLSWRTATEERDALRRPASVGGAVPGWRGARILHDRTGAAAALQAEAHAFDWSTIAFECDAWVAEQVTGYAEEVLKLVAARRAADLQVAAVQRSILALRLPIVMAVHHRLLYDSEKRLWSLVAQAAGERWATAQRQALGLDHTSESDEAALTLYRFAAEASGHLLSDGQRKVIELALRAATA